MVENASTWGSLVIGRPNYLVEFKSQMRNSIHNGDIGREGPVDLLVRSGGDVLAEWLHLGVGVGSPAEANPSLDGEMIHDGSNTIIDVIMVDKRLE